MASTIASTTWKKATGTVTVTGNFTANDTVIIGNVTYKFVASPSVANDVDIGGDAATSLDNLVLAINGEGTPGATTYATGTSTVPGVVATASDTVLTITARWGGSWANGIELREGTDGGTTFSVTRTMQGGAGAFHTHLADLRSYNQVNAEVDNELRFVISAVVGA